MSGSSVVHLPYKHAPGGVRIDLNNLAHRDPANQVFIFIEDTGLVRYYHVNKLVEIIRDTPDFPMVEMPIDAINAKFVMEHKGVEERHARAISLARMEEPGIILFCHDGTQLVIDGSHRYMKRFWQGKKWMKFYKFDEETIKPAELDLPDAIAKDFLSGHLRG